MFMTESGTYYTSLQAMPTISSNQKQIILIYRVEFLPQKHWEAYNEINSIKQGADFVHGCTVHKLIIWELHMFKIKISHLSLALNISTYFIFKYYSFIASTGKHIKEAEN